MATSPHLTPFALLAGASLLASCADSHAYLPEMLRMKEPEQRAPDPMPDSVAFVRTNLQYMFPESAKAHAVSVSAPRPNGTGWKICVRASFSNIAGKPAGPFTFVLLINDGKVGDRRRAEASDGCENETFSPV